MSTKPELNGGEGDKFDAFGAMDLSSSCSSSVQGEEDMEGRPGPEARLSGAAREPRSCTGENGVTNGVVSEDRTLLRESSEARPLGENRKRKAEDPPFDCRTKKDKMEEEDGADIPLKVRNKRRNIKEILGEGELMKETQQAQAEEQQRLSRIADKQKQILLEVKFVLRLCS